MKVIRKAWVDSWHTIKSHPKGAICSFLTWALGTFFYLKTHGINEVMEQINSYICYTILPPLGVFLLSFFWHLIRAPIKLKLEGAQNVIVGLQMETEKISALQKELEEKNKALDDRSQKEKIQSQLGIFLVQGEFIMKNCLKPRAESSKLHSEAVKWYSDTHEFIKEKMGIPYSARFISESGVPSVPIPALGQEIRKVWKKLNIHVFQLRKIMDMES